MKQDSRSSAWIAVVLGLLVLLLVLHVATPRVRLTSGEHLGDPQTGRAAKLAQDPEVVMEPSEGHEDGHSTFSHFADPLPSRHLPRR
jgi:hypothetical protein